LSRVGIVEFTFGLRALSSGRRFTGEGLFRVLLRYSANYLWTHLLKRPFSSTWLDFRHATGGRGSPEGASNGAPQPEPGGAGPLRWNPGLAEFGMSRSERR
jgi:hypothetical protein